ncbi:MAG: sulfite oxidase [Chloroflexi bacterium]|nr:sulfite oxidase [Chloroflexota bacterium]
MGLFVVRHQHDGARCPAQDPYLGAMLLNHLSRPNAKRHGIEIKGEAVVQREHTLYLIVEAEDERPIGEFMAPFGAAGTVEVYGASTCARAVAAGGCAATIPLPEGAPSLDPEDVCQQAIEAGLIVHRAHPLNAETSIPALIGGVVMPNAHFYVRNHFPIPQLDGATWRLRVGGLVDRPLTLSLRDLHNLPAQTHAVTLECAGNGRSLLEPAVEGEQWDLGAVSTAEWTGVPLVEVLERAGIKISAREVIFRGVDWGALPGTSQTTHFARSLKVDDARNPDVLLAYGMNGEPLPIQHGYPLRLVVPDWYGVASVKWLSDIEVTDAPFSGHYQVGAYFFEREDEGQVVREPVTLQRVRALITEPGADERVQCGDLAIRGVAWSGAAPIARVEVSVGGERWEEAHLIGQRSRHSWQWWELLTRVERPGPTRLRARATDLAGRTQPDGPEWNRLGYGVNAIHEVAIHVL